jgi:hypothetical protein
MHPLPIATAVAVLLVSLKVGDMILSSEQQKSVQTFCDDLALRLEYANVERIYGILRARAWQRGIYGILVASDFLFNLVPLALSAYFGPGSTRYFWLNLALCLVALSPIAWIFIWVARRMWLPSTEIFDWLFGASAIPTAVVHKFALLATLVISAHFAIDIFTGTYGASPRASLTESVTHALHPFAEVPIGNPRVPVRPLRNELFLAGIATEASLATDLIQIPVQFIAVDICLISLILLVALFLRASLWILRVIAWRVATYAKGAWAAIVALLAALLALTDLMLKPR